MTKENTTKGSTRWVSSQAVLTDTDWGVSGPLVVLQAYPDGSPHEPETGVALIHHGVPVTEAVAADVTVHDGIRRAAVARWKASKAYKNTLESLSSVKVPRSWRNNRVLWYGTGNSIQRPGINQNEKEYTKGYICICISGSLCCTGKINTPL